MASQSPFEAALATLGNNSQEKGKRFEEAIKWWLKTDKVWRNELLPDSVLLWSESPFRNGPDIGIDLTAEDHLGNIWAIQVKNWNSSSPLPKSEVDKFLAASNTKTFTRRLLVSTTESISINAIRAIEDQEKLCTLILRNQLEESTAWVEFGKQSGRASTRPKSLFAHQKKALDSVVRGLSAGGRGQLIMACGSGKTITAQRISEALDSKATLVLLPSLLLVQQTLQSWRSESTAPFISLSVCSDESVNGDEPVSRASELPFPVTTDPQVISQFLGLRGQKVIFSTYQSSEKIEDAIRQSSFKFDLVICDEAHRLAGKVDKAYGTVFREGALPSDRYLFMTATPKVFSTRLRKVASDEELEINSMDDVEKFGQVLHTFSFAEAIENNILTDYRVVLMGIDDSMVHDLVEARTFLDFDGKTVDSSLLASHYGVAKAMERYSIRRVISFHSRVNKAREFVALQPRIHAELAGEESIPMIAEAISGKDSAFKRKALLDQLRDLKGKKFGLIGNARCLTEGVDVPSLDGIAFVDPRSSQVDIVQAVGRAIRRNGADKSVGYIIIPVFFRGEELSEEKINESQFKPVWDVLNALKSHDSALQEEIDSIRRNAGVSGRSQAFPAKIIFDFPLSVPVAFSENIKTFLVDKTSSIWEEWLGKLMVFESENGHCRPKRQYTTEEEAALGAWVNHQRTSFNKGRLSLERIAKLEAVPNWTWDPFEEQWLEGFERLHSYAMQSGSSRVPSTFRDVSGKPLGKWVAKLRAKKDQLDQRQIELLESLPDWSWEPYQDQWYLAFAELQEISGRVGHTSVSRGLKFSDGRSVGGWVIKQRQTREELEAEKKTLLEGLPGWSWDPFGDVRRETIVQLNRYVSEFGNANVPQKYVSPNGFKLGYTVGRVRADFSNGRLDSEMQTFVESLPGWSWNARVDLWQSRFELLRNFTETNNRLPNKEEVYLGDRLGWWVSVQRQFMKKGMLSAEKIGLLESLNTWTWDVNLEKWENGYSQLLSFLELSGGRPPRYSEKTVDGFGVGSWISSQRRRFSRLTEEQQKKLGEFEWFQHHEK